MEFKNIKSDLIFKISVFGESGVGKRKLIRKYLKKDFEIYESKTTKLDIGIKKESIGDTDIVLQIWILDGTPEYRFLLPIYSRGSSVGVFIYDLTRADSLKYFSDFVTLFQKGQKNANQPPLLVMIGAKPNLEEDREIPLDIALNIANMYNFDEYFECNIQQEGEIQEVFNYILKYLIEANE